MLYIVLYDKFLKNQKCRIRSRHLSVIQIFLAKLSDLLNIEIALSTGCICPKNIPLQKIASGHAGY